MAEMITRDELDQKIEELREARALMNHPQQLICLACLSMRAPATPTRLSSTTGTEYGVSTRVVWEGGVTCFCDYDSGDLDA